MAFALVFIAGCDYQIKVAWSKIIKGDSSEALEAGILSADGSYLFTGYSYPKGYDGQALWLVRADNGGRVLWQKHFSDEFSGGARDIVELQDGNMIIAGREYQENDDSQLLALKVDPKGNTLWRKSLGGKTSDGANAIAATTDGNVVLVAYHTNEQSFFAELWVVKIDVKGDVLWEKNFGRGRGVDIAATDDGGVLVLGYATQEDGRSSDWQAIRLDSQGEIVWQRMYGGAYEDQARSITRASDGGFVMTGTLGQYSTNSIWVVKINPKGEQVWDTKMAAETFKAARDIARTEAGFVVVGYAEGILKDRDIYVLKLDEEGQVASEKTYLGDKKEQANAVIFRKSDTLIIAGLSENSDRTTDGLITKIARSY